jgi:Tol biopolymer transport system component
MKARHAILVALAAVVLVLVVAVTAAVITDDAPTPRSQSLAGGAAFGLVAYSYAGDIYVGDPATGETTAIVTNPEYEVNPVFSPDGKRIAFIRGDPQAGDSTIVVVRADGSDERVILPKGRKHRGFDVLAWTPDGGSLVAQLDTPPFTYPYGDGELSLVDSFGSGSEQLLTPPLTLSIGGHYFSTNNQVAPMFRPPTGDRIASADRDELSVFDPDLMTATRLGSEVLKRYEPYTPWEPTWSPDGTRIAFGLTLFKKGTPSDKREGGGFFVMSAEGDELRRIGGGDYWGGQWSPDSSRIAFERVRAETDRAVIVIVDLDTGKERSLQSTSARGKEAGARFSTVTWNNVVHHWYYEGWMWAPDGRSLLVLENHRTHPWVVDIKTDTVTELPWLADSMPSWQRVTSG